MKPRVARLVFLENAEGGVDVHLQIHPPLKEGQDSDAVAMALAALDWLSGLVVQDEAEEIMATGDPGDARTGGQGGEQ